MKKLILLFLILIVPILCYSQDTLKITSEQLRITNLIFIEHEKLSLEVPLLKEQINNLELINKSWEHTDSIRISQLIHYQQEIDNRNKSIDNLNKSLNNKQNIIKYGGIVSIVTIVVCLFLK